MAHAQKKCVEEGYTPIFVDESGFYLLPSVLRSWAPIAKTPVLREKAGRYKLSVIGALTLCEGGSGNRSSDLYTRIQEGHFRGGGVVDFVKHLMALIRGKLMVVWDGAAIHKGKEVRDFLSGGEEGEEGESEGRVLLARLPAYAPDLNPIEGVWGYLKGDELGNLCCHNLPQLLSALEAAIANVRRKPHVLTGCINQSGVY